MHYYKRNIGDYHKKAGRLSLLQHGVYTLLIDACYDREEFPTMEQAIDWVWASNDEEITAVNFVLNKFFDLDGETYVQNRVMEDLAKYHENAKINKRIATNRERNRTNRERTVNEAPPNHKPLTINHKPLTNNKIKTVRFKKPTVAQIIKCFGDRVINPEEESEKFWNHYESNGWRVGRNPMKSWQHAVTNWITRSKSNANTDRPYQSKSDRADEAVRVALKRIQSQGG